MPSTSEPKDQFTILALWQPLLGTAVIACIALVQFRLTPGSAIFLAMTLASTLIRTAIMGRQPVLPIAATVAADREKALVILVFLGMLALPVVYLISPCLDTASFQLPAWAIVLGVAISAVSQWLFWPAHADLDANWSPVLAVRDGHRLVTNGIYRRIRHPMYAAIFAQVAAQALLLGNGIVGPAGLIAFGVLYFVRIGPEERIMAGTFGAKWRAYAVPTGRLWPRLTPKIKMSKP